MSENEIFDKGDNAPATPKPKRKLSDKQLENLKKGREKMALKRAVEKEKLEKLKKDEKASKEHQKIKSTGVKKKRVAIKEINKQKEDEILQKLMNKEKKKEELRTLFDTLKVKCYGTAKNVKEYNQMKVALDGLDEDTLHDTKKLKAYSQKVLDQFKPKPPQNVVPLDTIKE